LDEIGFEDQFKILNNYVDTLGKELNMADQQISELKSDIEISPFREMSLDLKVKDKGVVAISGFTTKTEKTSDLVDLLNEMAVVEIGRIDTLTLGEREKLDALLAEQELTLLDLMDTEQAIEVGRFLAANYFVNGSVIEMAASVVIFGRIINVETGEVESVAQVIVPMDPDAKKLLT
jgi:TolB-like protein